MDEKAEYFYSICEYWLEYGEQFLEDAPYVVQEGEGVMTSRPMKIRVMVARQGEREKRMDQAVSIFLLTVMLGDGGEVG